MTATYPNLGAWVQLRSRLPSTTTCRNTSRIGNREYWNKRDGHYLGPAHDAVPLRVDRETSRSILPAAPERALHCRSLGESGGKELMRDRHQCLAKLSNTPDDPAIDCPDRSPTNWRSACSSRFPKSVDFSQETAETRKRYGMVFAKRSAKRLWTCSCWRPGDLAERGVRFIQVQRFVAK
jgi:hypothetical protein